MECSRFTKPTLIQIIFVLVIGAIFGGWGYSQGWGERREAKAKSIIINPIVEPEWETIVMNVSAYCPCEICCGIHSNGQTANGHWIKKGEKFVAAPKIYDFGTEMIIPGYNRGKIVKVIDRGGAIKGNRLDVYFDTHKEALEWGRNEKLPVKVRIKPPE